MTLRAEPKKKKQKKDTPPPKRRSFIARIFLFCLKWGFVLGVWAGIFILGVAAWYARELPAITRSPNIERKPSITVLANDGSVIARYGDIKGTSFTVADLPPHLIQAVLATEDRRFYYHFGLDPVGLARAVVVNVTKKGVVQGGSTITQQLAKNLFLTQERTLKRKIQEALLALWLEKELTKDEILSAYLNRVYMGAGTYGVDAASQVYFKKSVRDVNLREAAILAGLLKAPSKYSPRSNPTLANQRADVVMANMKDAGYLNDDEIPKSAALPMPKRKPVSSDSSQYFGDYVVEQLDDLIGSQSRDIIIETTFDPDIQTGAADALATALRADGAAKRVTQGSIVVMRRDGAVLAIVGGRDYTLSQFNRATHALRPPGSSFKPIVYLTALEYGYTPDTMVMDEPIPEGTFPNDYRPTNFNDEYYGEIPLRTALAFSLNTIAIQLIAEIGPYPVIDTARRLGITSDLVPNLSTALGSNGVPQIEMATAYAMIANGGVAVQPYAIHKIKDSTGIILYERPPIVDYPQLFSSRAIEDLRSMMQSVVNFGTGQGANLGAGIFAAGKTGTSQDYRDAWFSGFTDTYVATVWVGNDDNSSMKRVTGGSLPTQIWRNVMTTALNDPTPAPDDAPAADRSVFGSLLDRVLSPTDHQGTPGTAYEKENNSGGGLFWWRKASPEPTAEPYPKIPGKKYNE
jgi:penicillin-binding protein 1A